jgi:hypothetical protein
MMIFKLSAYVGLPHALLHLLAYRLIGKACVLDLDQRRVRALAPRTAKEIAFVRMFPALVTGSLALGVLAIWAWTIPQSGAASLATYSQTAHRWHQILWWVGIVILAYAGTGMLNLYWGVRLLLWELRHQPPHATNHYLNSRQDQH